jgi:hypothetical protein
MNVEKLIEDITKTGQIAHTRLEDLNPAVRGGWGMAIVTAKNKLIDLERQYALYVGKNSVAIFLLGDPGKVGELAKLIADEKNGFVVDANALYARIGHQVYVTVPQDRGSLWGSAQTYRMQTTIQEIMHEVGIRELPMPDRTEAPHVKSLADCVAHVRKTIRAACGDSFNKLYIERSLVKQALEIRYTGVMVPVIVTGAEEKEVYDLGRMFGLGASSVTLDVDTEVNEDLMRSTFESATKKLVADRKLPKMEPKAPEEEQKGKNKKDNKTAGKNTKAAAKDTEANAAEKTEDKNEKKE